MKLKDLDIYAIGNTIQMAGVIYAEEERMYLCMFPDQEALRSQYQEVLEMDLDDWKKFLFQTDVLETEIITKASDGTLAKAFVRKSQRHIDIEMQWAVWRRDKYRCRYCGNSKTPLTVDHLIVWEEGGPTVHENLLSACRRCNKTRGNLPYLEWLNHTYYRQVSSNLTDAERAANYALLATLPDIPRYVSKRSR
jgi:hypothetical protein